MYDVMVLRPGGGWATDTTGTLQRCADRSQWLKASNRKRVVHRVIDSRTGRQVTL